MLVSGQCDDVITVREVAAFSCQAVLLSAIRSGGRNAVVTHDLLSGDGSKLLPC